MITGAPRATDSANPRLSSSLYMLIPGRFGRAVARARRGKPRQINGLPCAIILITETKTEPNKRPYGKLPLGTARVKRVRFRDNLYSAKCPMYSLYSALSQVYCLVLLLYLSIQFVGIRLEMPYQLHQEMIQVESYRKHWTL